MNNYYLAIDLGASSGRHILGHLNNGRIELEEIYRFENGIHKVNGHLCWDEKKLFQEILHGIKKCGTLGKIPVSLSIDSWGIDFVLLDNQDQILGNMVSYRDSRTKGMEEKVFRIVPEKELYYRTGIQREIINTVYQLMAVKMEKPEYIRSARSMLMVADYFQFLLTGNKMQDYTNATTTQLVNPVTKDWDYELIDKLGFRKEMFLPISMPGSTVGRLRREIRDEVGFDCEVVLPCTHDTASAVLSVPTLDDDFLYISSGTWSLMGVERKEPDCSEKSRLSNFTNEGGYGYRFRYLKNIMGLWIIQNVKRNYDNQYSFADLCRMANEVDHFPSRVDVQDNLFLAPPDMTEAIRSYCRDTNQPVPQTPGEVSSVIYNSLAECYHRTAKEIERITGRKYARIHVVGGGSNADYLNELTAHYTGKTVYAGPSEATAIGNLAVQMMKAKEFSTVEEARDCIYHSSDIKIYGNQ